MKAKKILTISIISTFLLGGCSFVDAIGSIRSFGGDPLVTLSENPRATKASIMAAGFKPIRVQPTKKIQGTCYDYQLNSGNKISPYYIAFNNKDQVVAYSFTTCAEAESKGAINNEIPFIERK